MKEKQSTKKFQITRRKFVKTSTLVITGAASALGLGAVPLLRSDEALLRPPGALDEGAFLASCIKCGQCLQVCPSQVIKLDGLMGGYSVGTPYITPREGGCILTPGLPCILACPTGALSQSVSLGKEAEMGLAVISRPKQCLSILGVNDLVFRLDKLKKSNTLIVDDNLKDILERLVSKLNFREKEEIRKQFGLDEISAKKISPILAKMDKKNLDWLFAFTLRTKQADTACQICLEVCPIKEEDPISFIKTKDPVTGKELVTPTVEATCVGCGFCEERCPTEEASITIVPRMKWSEKVS